MPSLYEVVDRVKATEREYLAVEFAVQRQREAIQAGNVLDAHRTTLRDLDSAAVRLEATYVVRMWAEYETTLRSYRRFVTRDPDDQLRTVDLINWVAGVRQGRAVSEEARADVHEVREYRNSLVHERAQPAPQVSIGVARRRLNTFLAKLPAHWT